MATNISELLTDLAAINFFETVQGPINEDEMCPRDKWMSIILKIVSEPVIKSKFEQELKTENDPVIICDAILAIKESLNDAIKLFGLNQSVKSRKSIYDTPEKLFVARNIFAIEIPN